jgi:hypothetical protein
MTYTGDFDKQTLDSPDVLTRMFFETMKSDADALATVLDE